MNLTKRLSKNQMYSFILIPHIFKKIGYIGAILFYILENLFQYVLTDFGELKLPSSILMLFFMLMVTVSKEKIEDEMTIQIRAYSYSSAFFIGIGYAVILQPLLVFFGSYFTEKAITENHYLFVSLKHLLWFMLFQQMMMFWQLKKQQNED